MVTINFNNIEALETYLRSDHYDQAPFKADLKQKPSNEELDRFANLLRAERMACLLVASSVERQRDFDNLFLSNKRYQLQQSLKQAGQLTDSVSSEFLDHKKANFENVSRAKVNLARGVHAESGGLQFQKQQQVAQQRQQQVQQQQAMQTMLDKRQQQLAARSAGDLPAFVPNELTADDLKKLITRENIATQIEKPRDMLLKVWDDMAGSHANEIAEKTPQRVVSFVTPAAMTKILENAEHFSYGLVMSNLPDGFYLQEWNNKIILGYDQRSVSNKNDRLHVLRVNLEKTKVDNVAGDANQFELDAPENKQERISVNHRILLSNNTMPADKQSTLIELLHLSNGTWQTDKIIELLKKLDLHDDKNAIEGLTKAYLAGGADVVMLLLKKWSDLLRAERFDEFRAVFLKGKNDYSEYVTVEAMTNFDILTHFDVSERIWWKAATMQHRTSTGSANFNELISAFVFSVAEIKRMTNGQALPLKHPFAQVSGFNMKVALNRLMIILGRALDKEEQVSLLQGLDLGPEGAVVASSHDNYKLTSKEMDLSFEESESRLSAETDRMISFKFYFGNQYEQADFDKKNILYRWIDIRESEIDQLEEKIKSFPIWSKLYNAAAADKFVKKLKAELPDIFARIDRSDSPVFVQDDFSTITVTRNWNENINKALFFDEKNKLKAKLVVRALRTNKVYEFPVTYKDIINGLVDQFQQLVDQEEITPMLAQRNVGIIKGKDIGFVDDCNNNSNNYLVSEYGLQFRFQHADSHNDNIKSAQSRKEKDECQSQYGLSGDDLVQVKSIADKKSLGTNLKYYYRHIGQQAWTLPFDFYRSVAGKLARKLDNRSESARDGADVSREKLLKKENLLTYINKESRKNCNRKIFNDDIYIENYLMPRTGGRRFNTNLDDLTSTIHKALKKAVPKNYVNVSLSRSGVKDLVCIYPYEDRGVNNDAILIQKLINKMRKFVNDSERYTHLSNFENDIMKSDFINKSIDQRERFIEALKQTEAYFWKKSGRPKDSTSYSSVEDNKSEEAALVLEAVINVLTLVNKELVRIENEIIKTNNISDHDKMQSMLLHLVAQATTTKRQLLVGEDESPVDWILNEISRSVKNRNGSEKSRAEHAIMTKVTAILDNIATLPNDMKPSIVDIRNLYLILNQTHFVESRNELEINSVMFDAIKKYGDAAYDMFSTFWLRNQSSKTKDGIPKNYGAVNAPLLVTTIESISNISDQRKAQLLSVMARTTLPQLRVIDRSKVESIAEAMNALSPEVVEVLVKVMRKIQFDQSTELPYMDEMLAAIIAAKQFKEVTATTEEELTEFLQNRWPDTYLMKKRPASNILLDIVGTIRDQIDHFNVDDIVNELSKYSLATLAGKQIKTFRELDAEFRKPTVDLNQILQRVTDFEASIASMFSGTTGIALRTAYNKFAGKNGTPEMKRFMETRKFGVFLVEPLKANLDEVLGGMTAQLQVRDDFLHEYLAGFVGTIDETQDIGTILRDYGRKADQTKDFTAALTDIYNRDASDFKKVYDLWKQNNATLPMVGHQMLMDICFVDETIPMSEKLAIVYQILSRPNTHYSQENSQYALDELKKLMLCANALSADSFKFVMEKSFKHHIEKGRLFPVIPLVELMNAGGENEKVLVQHLLNLVSKTDADAEHEMIRAIDLTSQLLREMPEAVQLVQILAGIRQDGSIGSWTNYIQDLTAIISNQHHADKMANVITIVRGVLSDSTKFDVATLLRQLLTFDHQSLAEVAGLYQFKPYPAHDKLPEMLQCAHNGTLATWVAKFDLDPFSKRTDANATADQYSTSQLNRVVTGIRSMPDNEPLPEHEQIRLMKQSIYIAAVGNSAGISFRGKPAQPLTAWTRADLRTYADELVAQIRDTKKPEAELDKTRLTLLAVLRESYFRCTGKLPNSTQMVAAIMSINHLANILLQLNTGEGKSVLSSLLVTMEWAKGVAVNFSTSTSDLASRDEAGAAVFCDFLGVEHRLITNDSKANTYATSGVNYSTMAETSLYRAGAKLFGERIKRKEAPPTSLYIDESDSSTLDNYSTAFNLAIASDENPYAWIYPLINTFVDKPEYLNIDMEKGAVWDVTQDLHYLKDFLREEVRDAEKKLQIAALTDLQLKKWLSSATIAKQHQEGVEFVISRESRMIDGKTVEVDLAVPLDKSVPQVGSTRDKGVQQFLHARLQRDKTALNAGNYNFPIDSESFKSATETARNYIDRYTRKGGRLIGVSATLGSLGELAEQESKYDVLAFTIPPHLASQLEQAEAKFIRENERDKAIVKKLLSIREKQNKALTIEPQLIFARDINDVESLAKLLNTAEFEQSMKINELKIIVITGKESASDRKKKWAEAGQPNTITVTTPISTRGVDIPHDDENKIYVRPTRVVGYRLDEQMKGRVARYGRGGAYEPLYVISEGDIARYGIDLTEGNAKKRMINLERVYELIDEDAAVERHYTEEVDTVQNIALDIFNKWYKLIVRLNPGNHEALSAAREAFIEDMQNTWGKLLDASDPDKLYANTYVRRNQDGKLEVQALDEAVAKFEDAVAVRWENELAGLKGRYLAAVDVNAEDEYADRYRRYDAFDIRDAIAMRQAKKVAADNGSVSSILARSQAKEVQLHAATDVSAAYLEFAPELSTTDKTRYLKSAIHNQLVHYGDWLSKAVRSAKMQRSDKAILKASLKQIMASAVQDPEGIDQKALLEQAFVWINTYYAACENKADRYLAQPFVRQLINLAEQLQFEPHSLMAVKRHYVDHAYSEIKQQLEEALAWRKDGKWYHQIERQAAKQAADDILKVVAKHPLLVGDDELKDLYKVLLKQQMQLKNKFIVGFLHQNIKTTIRNGLASLDYLTSMRANGEELKKIANAELLLELNSPASQSNSQSRKMKQNQLHELVKEINLPCDEFNLQRQHQGFRQHYQLIVKVDKSQAEKWLALGLKEKSSNVYVKTFAKWEDLQVFEGKLEEMRVGRRQGNDLKSR